MVFRLVSAHHTIKFVGVTPDVIMFCVRSAHVPRAGMFVIVFVISISRQQKKL